jgi:hypothetical protein
MARPLSTGDEWFARKMAVFPGFAAAKNWPDFCESEPAGSPVMCRPNGGRGAGTIF